MSYIPYSEINSVRLYVQGTEDILTDSNVNVTSSDIKGNGNRPTIGGVYDARMGTTSHEQRCGICFNDKILCPGHPGSIKLNYPVLSPVYIKDTVKWLKVICFKCGQPVIGFRNQPGRPEVWLAQYVRGTRNNGKNLVCVTPGCAEVHPHIVMDKGDYFTIYSEKVDPEQDRIDRVPLFPHQIKGILSRITPETVKRLGKPEICHPSKFVLDFLQAPPNTIRPEVSRLGGGRSSSNDLTILLQTIIKLNNPKDIPTTLVTAETLEPDQIVAVHNLNLAVYDLIKGSTSTNKRAMVSNNKKPLTSVAKRWPRKFGRIRRNLMGKRVAHMGRSFITCDPYLRVDEVGVPLAIARDSQIEEVVRDYNINQLRVYFMNGVKRYPGCVKVQKASTGAVYYVERIKEGFDLEYGDKVYRNLVDGDIVNFNRQPSLEPNSVCAMRVVIMERGDTIRMNVLSCSFFNADFDGDAMNLIFTRTTRTSNEIRELSSPAQFFISYKDGRPKIGQAQDSLIGIAEMTRAATKFSKYHAMEMFAQIKLSHDFSAYPADKVFTGCDLVSILLQESATPINFSATPSFYNRSHGDYRHYDEADKKVTIDRGRLSGPLDKASVGEGAMGGLFHIVHNQYGAMTALELVFHMQQLALSYLYHKGVTVSMGDLLLRDDAMAEIHKIEQSLIAESLEITARLNAGKIIPPIGKTVTDYYEEQQLNALNPNHGDDFWPHIIRSIDPDNNNLYKMITYGSRGKLFNVKNIVAAIGQIEINAERIKENFAGRTLAYFTKYDADPASRGYIANSYISGIDVSEFVFHAMDNRYQLINKALSTSITGMHNRMAIKNLESMIVDNYRQVVSGDKIVQFLYGDTGVDPRYLERVVVPTMKADLTTEAFEAKYRATTKDLLPAYRTKKIEQLLAAEFEQLEFDRKFYQQLHLSQEVITGRMYSDSVVSPVAVNRIIEDTIYNLGLHKTRAAGPADLNPEEAIRKITALCDKLAYGLTNEMMEKTGAELPTYMRLSTTMLQVVIRSYLNIASLMARGVTSAALDIILARIKTTYNRSLISYGKAVGIIAAQSISEPMTQMVLDSHHNSGASSTKKKGMFRIREILGATPTYGKQAGSGMKAPAMTLQVLPQFRQDKNKVQEIANHIEMLSLQRFVKGWQIFFERFGEPVHPNYKHEVALIREYLRYNTQTKPPVDLSNWCVRIVFDKYKLIEKQMKMETIVYKLRETFPSTFCVYATDNAENIVMRVYLRQSFHTGKERATTAIVEKLVDGFMNCVVRGVKGVKAAYVKETTQSERQADGSIKAVKNYYIFTDGTNLRAVLANPYIEAKSVQSDSIIEMQELFGRMVARNKIITELRHQVGEPSACHFGVYADAMCYTGVVTSIDRYGSAKRDSSILQRISDADPVKVIEESAINGYMDDLRGVSPPIMVGKNPRVGDLYNSFKIDTLFVRDNVKSVADIMDAL